MANGEELSVTGPGGIGATMRGMHLIVIVILLTAAAGSMWIIKTSMDEIRDANLRIVQTQYAIVRELRMLNWSLLSPDERAKQPRPSEMELQRGGS